jgi:predicted AAA+ superfamily ATPase
VALVGSRQVGKTTLARTFLPPTDAAWFDLEDPADLERLSEPMTALSRPVPLVVIDEVQRAPEIFPVLRVLVDRPGSPRFLVLGSASPALLRQSSESLAGRVEVVEVGPLTLRDVGTDNTERLWVRGGYPRSYLAETDEDSRAWRASFVRTFLERDLPQLALNASPVAVGRFWAMLAHLHGQVWSAGAPARSLGVSEPTVRRYLDALTGTFMVRQLQPWHENLQKRQVKSPKVYFRDSGLLHHLLGVADANALFNHPRLGASWEGFAMEEVLSRVPHDEAYFWATHAGAELDLLLLKDGARLGYEFKRADAPSWTPSMRIARSELRLDKLTVVVPGTKGYPLADNVEVTPLTSIGADSG